MKVGARVVPGTVEKEIATQTLRFHVTDGTVSYPVVFKGLPPDTFTDSVEVVVEGRLQRDGVIHATNVLAKCGSALRSRPQGLNDAARPSLPVARVLVGLWGAITGFVGGAQRRLDLQQSARHATFALFGALLVASSRSRSASSATISASSTWPPTPAAISHVLSLVRRCTRGKRQPAVLATVLSLFAMLSQLFTSRRHRLYLPYVAP